MEAQQPDGSLTQNVMILLTSLNRILGGVRKLVSRPSILLDGELGENVDKLLVDVDTLANSLGERVDLLVQTLGLAKG